MPALVSRSLPFFAFIGFVLFSRAAAAATLNVPSQYATIQSAVNAATNGDTVLVAGGTYTGPGNVDVDFGGKNITVASQNGATSTIIDCQGTSTVSHRGFILHSSETNAIISGLTIEDGNEGTSGGMEGQTNGGGAIFTYRAGATIQNCILKNNTAAIGGGVYVFNSGVGAVSVINCLIENNASGYGAGVDVQNSAGGTVTVSGSMITGNAASISGGGFYNLNNSGNTTAGTIILSACIISSNSANGSVNSNGAGGGGVCNQNNGGTITLTNCALFSNSATSYGGGLLSQNNSGVTTVNSCTLTGNQATFGSGGGVYVSSGVNLTDDIVYADTNGEVTGGYPTVNYCDVKGGYSGTGNINADPLFTLSPTDLHLLSGSPCIGAGTDTNAPSTTIDGRTRPNPPSIGAYELDPRLQTTTTLSSSLNPSHLGQSVTFTAAVTGGGAQATGTVAFTVDGTTQATVPLAGTGKAAYTTSSLSAGAHLIQAIYSGDANLTPSKSAVLTQMNGMAGTAITLSSSLNPSVAGQYVTFQATLTNSGSGAVGKPTGTVTFNLDGTAQQTATLFSGRSASYTTSSVPVGSHTVTATYNGDANFAASTSSALTQTVLPHVSPQYVSPSGSDSNPGTQAAPRLTIQAAINATLNGDMVIVEDGSYTGSGNVNLDFEGNNLTVTSQNGPLKTIIDCGGNSRGFYLHYGETQAVISGFTIQNGSANGGAGIYNACKGLTIQNCIIKNNVSGYGSGGGIYNSGVLGLTGCTLSGNMASDGNYGSGGGGVSNDSGYLTLVNCTFIGNTAVGGGGGILNVTSSAGSLAMTNCVVINNSSSGSYGGGLDNSASYGANTVTNCTFTGNSAYYSYTGSGLTAYVGGSATLTLTNDILYGDNGSEIGTYPAASVSHCNIQGYPYGSGHVDADPLFFSATDLHLQNGSPCISAGTAAGAPATTIDGKTRPNPPSMGAYEAAMTATATALASSLNPSTAGQSVTFAATVTGTSGTPTGTVTFTVDGAAQAPVALSGGQAAFSTASLAAGSHSVTAVYSDDQFNIASASTALMQTVNPAATSMVINDTDGGLAYAGSGWGYYPSRGVGDVQDDVHATTVNGDSVSYTFTGTSIRYLAETNTDQGNVQVFLDGTLQATVSAYSAARKVQQVLWSASGLAAGPHTLKLVKAGGSYMLLDALAFTPSAVTAAAVNDTSGSIAYTGASWGYYAGRGVGDVQDDVHAATANGSFLTFSFSGASVSYITETNSDEGTADVYLDGTFAATVNAYSPARQVQQTLWSASGLAAGPHTLKIVKTGGSYLLLDAFLATPASSPSVTTLNDTGSGISYSGSGWSYYAGRGLGDVQDDVHATTINGDSVSCAFTGTSVSYVTETSDDEGTVDVYVDGAFQQTVNCQSSSRQVKQAVYSVSGLASGPHTLKLVKTGGAYMLLDAVTVQ